MCYQQCQNDQGNAGADAAAFLGDFNTQPGQAKEKAVAQDRNTAPVKNQFGYGRRTGLQVVNDAVQKGFGEGNCKSEERQGEPDGFGTLAPKYGDKPRDQKQKERQNQA